MKRKIVNFIKKFLEIDELQSQITQIDNELQDTMSNIDGMHIDIEDKPSYYDMESHVEHIVNDGIADIIERVETLENA
jgi:predicted transcriptional regulator